MINYIILFIKKNPFLYNLAKKINAKLNKTDYSDFTGIPEIIYYAFIMKNPDELSAIKENYKNLQKYNTKLFVLVDNPDCDIIMHKLIRENPDISFASAHYFKKHRAKLLNHKLLWLNYTDSDVEMLDYLI